MSTPVLTRLLMEAVQFQQPSVQAFFVPSCATPTKGGMNPPIVIVHGNSLEHVTESYKPYLEGHSKEV
jgi:GTP-binding protein